MGKIDLDPEKDEELRRHSLIIEREFMEKMSKLVWGISPKASVFYNSRLRISPTPETGIRPEASFFSHFLIESLPSGKWGILPFSLLCPLL